MFAAPRKLDMGFASSDRLTPFDSARPSLPRNSPVAAVNSATVAKTGRDGSSTKLTGPENVGAPVTMK